eukprot:COSAG06_NODE_1177_length_10397_cov_13.052821_5_plen_347_part_00
MALPRPFRRPSSDLTTRDPLIIIDHGFVFIGPASQWKAFRKRRVRKQSRLVRFAAKHPSPFNYLSASMSWDVSDPAGAGCASPSRLSLRRARPRLALSRPTRHRTALRSRALGGPRVLRSASDNARAHQPARDRSRAAQAYIDNLKATGQVEDGCIVGLDGTAWTGGLAVTAEEGAAMGASALNLHARAYAQQISLVLLLGLPVRWLGPEWHAATAVWGSSARQWRRAGHTQAAACRLQAAFLCSAALSLRSLHFGVAQARREGSVLHWAVNPGGWGWGLSCRWGCRWGCHWGCHWDWGWGWAGGEPLGWVETSGGDGKLCFVGDPLCSSCLTSGLVCAHVSGWLR